MGKTTKIQWCHSTCSPWNGCAPVSPGCAHCYAAARDKRHLDQPKENRKGKPPVCHWGKGALRVAVPSFEATARRLNRQAARTLVCYVCGATKDFGLNADGFCEKCELEGFPQRLRVFPSMCDWLDPEVPVGWLAEFLRVVHETPNLDWLLLTKRPELFEDRVAMATEFLHPEGNVASEWLSDRPPANVWIGVSVEDQKRADERIPKLLQIPARVRFLSVEPLLGPVDLTRIADRTHETHWPLDVLRGWNHPPGIDSGKTRPSDAGIDWVIVGGESGPGARQCHIEWIADIVQQCKAAGVPCFVKQLGSKPTFFDDGSGAGGMIHEFRVGPPDYAAITDPKGGNIKEWPEDLRVREWPEGCGKREARSGKRELEDGAT